MGKLRQALKLGSTFSTNAGLIQKDNWRRGIIRLQAKLIDFTKEYTLRRWEEYGEPGHELQGYVYYHGCIARRENKDAVFDLSQVRVSLKAVEDDSEQVQLS